MNWLPGLIIFVALSHSGCGTEHEAKTIRSVPTKSVVDRRSSRFDKLDKALQDYFAAYGIPGGLNGWKERFDLFLVHMDATERTSEKVSLENVLGRLMQDLSIRNTRRKVGSSSAWTFSLFVHKFMSMCRAMQYMEEMRQNIPIPNREEFLREFESAVKLMVEFLTMQSGTFSAGQRHPEYGNTVGLMDQILTDHLMKTHSPSPDPKAIAEESLRIATEIYELDQLKKVPQAVLKEKMSRQAFNSLSTLLMHCSHNDIFPGLYDTILDKCYTGLLLYKKALDELLKTGDLAEGSASKTDFNQLLKTIGDILADAEKAATDIN